MYTLLIFIVLLILSIVLQIYIAKDKYSDNSFGIVGIVVFGIIIIGMLISIPFTRVSDERNIAQINSIKSTIEESRKNNISELERVELQNSIIEVNKQIANMQFDLNSQWNWWTSDKVAKLKYIK